MGKPHKQEESLELDTDDDEPGNDEPGDVHRNMDADDDFTDDWISHVDDYDSSDDVNNW